MSNLESTSPKAGKSEKVNSRKATQLTDEAHHQLEKQSRRLGIKNQEYASAAIAYFAESGLDPRKMTKASLAKVEQRVVQETFDVRQHNADIGNRLVGVIRTFERNIGLMVQQQQTGTFKYLESIERNILGYLVNLEENLLTTILERAVAGNVENYINRVMLQILTLQLNNKQFPFSEVELSKLTASYDQQRDGQVVVKSRELLESKKTVRPKVTAMPAFVEIPKAPSTAKPAAGAVPVTTGTPPGTPAPTSSAPAAK